MLKSRREREMDILLTSFTFFLARAFFSEEIKARRYQRYWHKYVAEQAPNLIREQKMKLKMTVDHEF